MDASFDVLWCLRIILFAASAGTLVALFLFPTFVNVFERIIAKFEVVGSLPRLIASVTIGQIKNSRHYLQKPRFSFRHFRILGIPKRFMLLNTIVTGIYTVGVLSSLYAAYLSPAFSTTASQASGIINGVATIILTIFIDPQLGLITDRAIHDEGSKHQLGKIYVMLMLSRFLGTLLAQLFIVPAAYLIAWLVQVI